MQVENAFLKYHPIAFNKLIILKISYKNNKYYHLNIQGVAGGKVNNLGGGVMDYFE
jgi:hypothetical protein